MDRVASSAETEKDHWNAPLFQESANAIAHIILRLGLPSGQRLGTKRG